MLVDALAILALGAWLGVLVATSGAWRTRERLAAQPETCDLPDLGSIVVLIPARNEAASIPQTIASLADQGRDLAVIVIDDESDDGTAAVALDANRALPAPLALEVISGQPLPAGWGGKLWALEQGLGAAQREFCLLLDAEIELSPGVVGELLARATREDRALVSVMATLRCVSFWEKLLVPPFIFFFKLLYPFARVNDPASRTAAAAGGCILIRTAALREIGGFASLRDALIDDCTLAARIKGAGHAIWLGLSHRVRSLRPYPDFDGFRQMVTRTAFTQLRYSGVLLVLVVSAMLLVFLVPVAAPILANSMAGRVAGIAAILAMGAAFTPTVRFYGLPYARVLTLPVAAILFLAMTIESALKYWRGIRAEWKGRTYAAR